MIKSLLCRSGIALVFGWLLASAPALSAQTATLAPGTRVRVTVPDTQRFVGTVAQWRGDTLFVSTGSGPEARVLALSPADIRSLQISGGRTSRLLSALKGAGVGGIAGAVGGGVVFLAESLVDECSVNEDLLCFSSAEALAIGLLVGAYVGIPLGAVGGFLFPSERWNSVVIATRPALTLNARGGRVHLGLVLRLP